MPRNFVSLFGSGGDVLPVAAGGGSLGAFRSAISTAFAATGTCVADMPAGVASGDYLLAYAVMDTHSSVWTPPAGWTEIEVGGNIGAAPDGQSLSLAVRVAGGSEPANYTWTNNNANNAVIIIGAWLHINAVTPRTFDTVTLNATANAPPVTVGANGGTAALNDCIAYFVNMDKTSNAPAYDFTAPAGYTKRIDVNNGWVAAALHTLDQSPAGATGTINSTAQNGPTAGWSTSVVALATA